MSHALLSPSAAHRWLNCPKSLRAEEPFPDSTSDAAVEGTIAHALCALLLLQLKQNGVYNTEDAVFYAETQPDNYTKEDFEKFYTPDMLSHAEDYANYVWSTYQKELKGTPDAVLMVETDIDLSSYGEGMHGTTDSAIVSDNNLHIFDFKYGRGVRVEAEENPQMMIYALGNVGRYGGMYAFGQVEMTIYQPRISNISSFDLSRSDLLKWGDLTLKPKAADAYNNKGKFAAGPWCKFCKAKAVCKTLARYCTDSYITNKEKSVDELSQGDIRDIIKMSNDITSWLDAVKDFASKQLQDGHPIEGLKLVEGRSTRKYADEGKVATILHDNGFEDEQIYDKKLKTITSMTKTLTKKVFDALLSDEIIKPHGSPTLAMSDDPRPEYNSLDEDFGNVNV